LLIVLDCGTNSRDEIEWLTARGIDSVVVDHHLPAEHETVETVLLNPKAWVESERGNWDLKLLCAAGLAFFLVQGMATELGLPAWDDSRAILLAGLASYVDMMPLVGLNRILVKHSLWQAQKASGLEKVPGLAFLEQLRQANKFTAGQLDEKTYGLFLGPCLNAPGRLGDAKDALRLLLAQDTSVAKRLAKKCFDLNERRKRIQHPLTARALAAAETKINFKVILLADKKCHPGVGGIIASDVKEAFNRPTIIASWHKLENADGGFWKASGRSIEEYNMGKIIQDAVSENLVESGGGHEMAGGFSFTESQREKLEHWLNENSGLDETHFVRKMEIIAPAENFGAGTWYGIYRTLEPFGNGNPEPSLVAMNVVLTRRPVRLEKSGNDVDEPSAKAAAAPVAWAMRGVFERNKKPIAVECTDLARAEKWKVKGRYDFDLWLTGWRFGTSHIYGFRAKPEKTS
jgi:single-stranded-DNA-specific exonuclease